MFPGPQATNRSHDLSVCLLDIIMPNEVGSGWEVPQKPFFMIAEMATVTSLGIAVTEVDISTSQGPPTP